MPVLFDSLINSVSTLLSLRVMPFFVSHRLSLWPFTLLRSFQLFDVRFGFREMCLERRDLNVSLAHSLVAILQPSVQVANSLFALVYLAAELFCICLTLAQSRLQRRRARRKKRLDRCKVARMLEKRDRRVAGMTKQAWPQ